MQAPKNNLEEKKFKEGENQLPQTQDEEIQGKNKKKLKSKLSKENSKEMEVLCQICFSNNSNVILMPCLHSGICKDCCASVLVKVGQGVCPFCRKVRINFFFQIFFKKFF